MQAVRTEEQVGVQSCFTNSAMRTEGAIALLHI